MTWLEEAKRLKPYIVKGVQTLTDKESLEVKSLYELWSDLVSRAATVKKGYKFRHGDRLYKTVQPEFTFTEVYEPGAAGTESLFEEINESHAGTLDDPIPYSGNMALESGKYYEQHGVVYVCFRDTINPVYADLSALVDMYVKEVE